MTLEHRYRLLPRLYASPLWQRICLWERELLWQRVTEIHTARK